MARKKKTELLPPDDTAKEQAKRMFMEYVDHNEICKQLQVQSATLVRWRKEGQWALEREESERELLEDAFAGRRVQVSRITKATIEELERGLQHLRTRPTPPTIQEVERLSIILSNLDKISRLDANKSTENIALKGDVRISADEIRQILKADPFFPKHE